MLMTFAAVVPAFHPAAATQKTLFLSQPLLKHQSSSFWSQVEQGELQGGKGTSSNVAVGYQCRAFGATTSSVTAGELSGTSCQSLISVSTCTSRILQLKSSATLFALLLIAASARAFMCVVAETRDYRKHQV